MTPNQAVIIKSHDDPPLEVLAYLGEGRVKVSGGYGGWELVDRPKNISITRWAKSEPYRLAVPILLDRFAENVSVEPPIRSLESMARRNTGNDEPPVINVHLPGSVPRSPNVDWVINDIQWGDLDERREDGARIRQDAVIEFLQFIDEDDTIKFSPAKKRKKKKKKTKKGSRVKTYTVKAGDTLSKIAAKYLGQASRWREIAKLNNIRDPKRLRVGQKLKLP